MLFSYEQMLLMLLIYQILKRPSFNFAWIDKRNKNKL